MCQMSACRSSHRVNIIRHSISYDIKEKFLREHFNHCNYEKRLSNGCDILVPTNLHDPDSRETTVNEVRERG